MILAQIGSAIPTSPLGLIIASTLATKIILGILVALSLLSWTIMFAKWRQFASLDKVSRDFLTRFEHAERFEQAAALASRSVSNPYTRILARAAQFIQASARSSGQVSIPGAGGTAVAAPPARATAVTVAQVEAMRLLLDAETNEERDRVARFIPSLGTIGSVSPLIGLLGTVLGVIDAFIGLAAHGSGNIGAVAPGVAEALIATAAALSVAIPAVFGYNVYANRLNRFDNQLEAFGSEVIALAVREGRV
ncbi:MAG TPA: MotA/TolQ/ExbB proton channel family protein [Gemmatimonadaceae bacterium]|jgi:biopolymer transport protein TolQ|nr:MotA/TolQ/ExbB proton channel family protein [Gemmatimonadaceae bacterium]